jgi:hypothetical protein
MPWHFLELLCQLDEREEAATADAANRENEQRGWEAIATDPDDAP